MLSSRKRSILTRYALIFGILVVADVSSGQDRCSAQFSNQFSENLQTPPLHIASFSGDRVSLSRAGVTEICLQNLRAAEKSAGLNIKKVQSDRENSVEYLAAGSSFIVRYKFDPFEFKLLSFDLTQRKFDSLQNSALGSSLLLQVENQSEGELQLTLKLRNGPTTYTAVRTIAFAANTQTIRIPMEDFKVAKNWDHKNLETADLQIEVLSESKAPLRLKFRDSLIVEKDPRHPAVRKAMQDAFFRGASRFNYSRKMSDALFNQMLKRLFDVEIQKKAFEIVRSKRSFKIFLDRYGLSTQVLSAKLTPTTKTVDGHANRPFFSADSIMAYRQIPIESGEFAREHGELSHAYQLASLLYGTNREDAAVIMDFFSSTIKEGGAPGMWAVWDSLFDGAGNSLPSEPRYWRDRFEKAQELPSKQTSRL